MLLDGWLPFNALGWFNSPFEYSHESAGDMSLIAADVPTWVARGGSQAVEWAKRGHTLIRVGSDHAANASLVRAILDECEKAGIYVMFSPPASTFATDNTTEARAALISNLTMVMDHPALWGYYICDDCCKGFDYLWQLAEAYDLMKQVDPYHLTAGFLECGEMHAFVEPHLSLDAPMRENYRPDMAFHAADGWERAGSDGELRLPPMTFTPIMNGPQVERQAVPAVARSNVYLGLVGANMVHIHMYVYNQLNEIRKQNTAMVDQIFAELDHLSSSILTSHDAVHPVAQVVPLGPDSDNIRTRAWRRNDGCIHVVVVNVPPEGGPPSPANFKVQLTGLTAAEAKAGLTPLFDGCVVSFVAPKNQTYVCRHLELTHHTNGVKHHPELVAADSFSDYIGPAATNVYRIGCREGAVDEEEANILAPATNNLVPDPSFEDSQQPGTPAYNLHSHQAYWHLVLGSNDANPRFDDASWLHIDGRLPYSGLPFGVGGDPIPNGYHPPP
eukprot:g898.t1